MRILDLISYGAATGVNNRNVQVLTDVVLKKGFRVDGVTYRSGSRFASAEIEVQKGKAISMRLLLGPKRWTNFAGLEGNVIENEVPESEVHEDAEPEVEVETEPAVPAVPPTEEEDEDETVETDSAVPHTED